VNDIDRMQLRIDELERRVRELEARPAQVQPVIVPQPFVYPAQPYMPAPWWTMPVITCSAPREPSPCQSYVIGTDGTLKLQ
jgi:hypothetical protein